MTRDDEPKDKAASAPGGMREVPIEWEALEDAFENNAPEVHSYLHLVTGEVLRVVDGVADPEMHARIASDPNYLRVEPVSSREQYRWMERFIAMVEDLELRATLARAIDGKGAFRRFKDALMSHSLDRERWFSFRSERLRVFMEAWLSAHALLPVARTRWEPDPDGEAPAQKVATPTPRSSEATRKQLADVARSLTGRDLEKVLAFAEFVRARRAARDRAPEPAADAKVKGPEEASSEGDDEEPTPSSRRRAASAKH